MNKILNQKFLRCLHCSCMLYNKLVNYDVKEVVRSVYLNNLMGKEIWEIIWFRLVVIKLKGLRKYRENCALCNREENEYHLINNCLAKVDLICKYFGTYNMEALTYI